IGYDQVEVAGAISLDGVLNVDLDSGFIPKLGDTFTILKNDTTIPITGAFAGLLEGALITVPTSEGSFFFQISYVGGAGHDVVLTGVSGAGTVVTADQRQVDVSEGMTAINSGRFFDGAGQNVTLTASIGSIVQTGTNGGTWNWSYVSTDNPGTT